MVTEQKDFVGKGWSFPIIPGADGRLRFEQGAEKVQQSIWLILSTAPAERQMLPEFGCGIHDLVFEANTAALRGLAQQRVSEALARWEPRIDVTDVQVDSPEEARNYLRIKIDFRLRSNNAFYNIVYPFYLNEGVDQGAG